MELRVWLLMEVNSCLTILPSDVCGRSWANKRPAPRNAARGSCCCRRLSSTRSGLGPRTRQQITQQSYAMACCFHAPTRSGKERCVCLCTTIFCCLFKEDARSPTTCRPGWMKRTRCISRKRKQLKSRGNVLMLTRIQHFFFFFVMPLSLPKPSVKGCLSLKRSHWKASYLPKE